MTAIADAAYLVLSSRLVPGLDGGYTVATLARARSIQDAGATAPLLLTLDPAAPSAHAEHRRVFADRGEIASVDRMRNLFDDALADPLWLRAAAVSGEPAIGVEYREIAGENTGPVLSIPVIAGDPDWHLTDAAVVVHGYGVIPGGFGALYLTWLQHVVAGLRAEDPERIVVVVCESRQLGELIAGWSDPHVRIIHTVHNSHLEPPYEDPNGAINGLWTRWFDVINRFDAVLWPTAAQRADVEARFGARDTFAVVPNPVEQMHSHGAGAHVEQRVGANAHRGTTANAEHGAGADAENGTIAHAEHGASAHVEHGVGRTANGVDAENGTNAPAEHGAGAHVEHGVGRTATAHAEGGAGAHVEHGVGRTATAHAEHDAGAHVEHGVGANAHRGRTANMGHRAGADAENGTNAPAERGAGASDADLLQPRAGDIDPRSAATDLHRGATDPHRVVMLGRIAAQKRVDLAVHAWARVIVEVPDAHLDIYGDGPLREQIGELIDELGVAASITLHGHVDDRDAAFSRAALMLVSTAYEGQGLSIAEALVRGLPVVSFDVRYGPRETIGDAGVLVPPGDVAALADAVIALLSDDERRRTLAVRAIEEGRRLAPEAVTRALVPVLERVLATPSRRAP
ncbi:glycosyltransferase [Microbacterium marmarense]|uniref:Glycosyltransferase n=1 Tax=Microbacterium marmarense TaxID=3122051 RepID=A0ABU8LUZ8_9MICO